MADYRQECSTPGCAYTGFTGHSPGCPVPFESARRARERQEAKDKEEQRWTDFFDSMSDEELFQYAKTQQDKLDEVARFKIRRDRVQDYLRRKHKAIAYLNWKRSG